MQNQKKASKMKKKISLGIPLAVAGAATVLSIFPPFRRFHSVCGIVFTALSAWHAWQYREKLKQDLLGRRAKCVSTGTGVGKVAISARIPASLKSAHETFANRK